MSLRAFGREFGQFRTPELQNLRDYNAVPAWRLLGFQAVYPGIVAELPRSRETMANGMNQYTSVGGQGLDYDHRFNLKTYEGATFTHDAQNLLISASRNGTTVNFGWSSTRNKRPPGMEASPMVAAPSLF